MTNRLTLFLTTMLLIIVSPIARALPAGKAYYGTNYTVPFAHAYRALESLGIDHRRAIDRDVYHMSRLGLNAFRLHLWDVELSDGEGNLLDNEHLALLDHLIASLEARGISIILTAQTNFGNGYPERNSDPNGAYSYRYEKCKVHDTASAADAQERYLRALASHVNPQTGLSYAADPAILGIEINNEPCHSGSHEEITAYVDRMAAALRQAGWKKDILYNVSHNLWRTQAFFDARIDGTTYQWYPTGLVNGRTRKGNFLPVLDSYDIPFDSVRGYKDMPRLIYEYDPADVLDSYLYPAAARTFRKAGFDWVTQFAYDPIDMARHNSEYQTHFLNLAYTPGKAIGMMIAAEAMRRIPKGKDYGKYPTDTVFGDFTVSARRDLALLNDGTRYYHSNSSSEAPLHGGRKLRHIAGTGNSPMVDTDGLGAYFLDRLDGGTWRLEIMPDAVLMADPFGKPSLGRSVGEVIDAPVAMTLRLPGLPADFAFRSFDGRTGRASGSHAVLSPGVWLLGADDTALAALSADDKYGDGRRRLGEYVAPAYSDFEPALLHSPRRRIARDEAVEIRARYVAPGGRQPDSIMIYPASVNFWREDNSLYRMKRTGKYEYCAVVDPKDVEKDCFRYNVVVHDGGNARTYPGGRTGTPLDWDYDDSAEGRFYRTSISGADEPVVLLNPAAGHDGLTLSTIPECWNGISLEALHRSPMQADAIRLRLAAGTATELAVAGKYVADIMADHADCGDDRRLHLRLGAAEGCDSVTVNLVNTDGFCYSVAKAVEADGTELSIAFDELTLSETLLNPAPYPSFLSRRFTPDPATATPLRPTTLQTVEICAAPNADRDISLDIEGIWIE